ncbi:hypothetical protein ScPMuIL_012299 [Solemya velum]
MAMARDHSYSCLSANIGPNEQSPEHVRHLDRVIADFMVEQNIPGAGLAISMNGKMVYQQGYGLAGVGRLALSTTLFRIASISKTITAIGILRLCQEGKLELHSQVFGPKGILFEYKPAKSQKGDKRLLKITVRNLLEHSSGWDRDTSGDPVFWRLEYVCQDLDPNSPEALLRFMMKKKLNFSPGSRYAYSNLGYLVLGMVLERVTGVAYEDYMCDLLSEVNINRMRVGFSKKRHCEGDEAEYFNNRDPLVQNSIFPEEGLVVPQYGAFAMETTGAYGGWVVSAVDLIRLLDSLSKCNTERSIIGEAALTLMVEKPSYETGQNWYGLGLDVQHGGATWGHTGEMDGTSSTFQHHFSGLSWTILFNSWSHDSDIDGLIKYAISTVSIWPLWQRSNGIIPDQEYEIISDDGFQIVNVLFPHEKLIELINEMKIKNYAIKWISSMVYKSTTVFNIIWNKLTVSHENQTPMFIFVDLKEKNAKFKIQKASEKGYFITLLDCYMVHNVPHFLILCEKKIHINDQKVFLWRKIDSDYLGIVEEYMNSDYKLEIQCVLVDYNSHDQFVSAVFTKIETPGPNKTISWLQITSENFQFELSRLAVKCYELIFLQFYNDFRKEEPSVSAIWCKKSDLCTQCLQRNGVSRFGFLYELRESCKEKLPLLFLTGYYSEGVVNFAGVWGSSNWTI